MLWFEITARAAPDEVEAVAAMMREAAPGGVTVEEPITVLGPEMGFSVRGGEPVLVRAYLPGSELGAVLTEQLRREAQARFPALELLARPLYEEDWAVSWREFFGPVDYGGRIVIVPSWAEPPAASAGRIVVRLDPGQAFGTGHHETTRLCLAALEDYVRPGDAVLDVGTGSGVLAIAAVALGAETVVALDLDPVALRVAGENCAANGALAVAFQHGTLTDAHAGSYEVVVANISTQANLALLPVFPRVLRPGGRLLLSGVLAGDAARFRTEAPACGLALFEVRVERDWCLLGFRRMTAA